MQYALPPTLSGVASLASSLMTSQCGPALGRRPTQHQLGRLSLSLRPPHPLGGTAGAADRQGTKSQGSGPEVGAPPDALWASQWGLGPSVSRWISCQSLTSCSPLTQGSHF